MDQSTQVQTILDQVSRLLSNVECLEYPSLGLEDITEGMSVVELVRWWDENWKDLDIDDRDIDWYGSSLYNARDALEKLEELTDSDFTTRLLEVVRGK